MMVAERGLLAVPGEVWSLAVRRAEVIGPLARPARRPMDRTP